MSILKNIYLLSIINGRKEDVNHVKTSRVKEGKTIT